MQVARLNALAQALAINVDLYQGRLIALEAECDELACGVTREPELGTGPNTRQRLACAGQVQQLVKKSRGDALGIENLPERLSGFDSNRRPLGRVEKSGTEGCGGLRWQVEDQVLHDLGAVTQMRVGESWGA